MYLSSSHLLRSNLKIGLFFKTSLSNSFKDKIYVWNMPGCKHVSFQSSLAAWNKELLYIFPVMRLEYLNERFWVAELGGNWISYINLIPWAFWGWQRRILFRSQAVYAFHCTKWCNELKTPPPQNGVVQFPAWHICSALGTWSLCRHMRHI